MSRPVKYESHAAKPIAVSLRLNREIAELVHEMRDSLPGVSTTERLQGVLSRALLRERDDLALGACGHALRVLPNGGFELVARVADSRGLTRLDHAARLIEEGDPTMAYRTDTPNQIHNDQLMPPDPAVTNASSLAAADRSRQLQLANEAAGAAKPWWTNPNGTKNLPNGDVKKADSDEAEELKKDGLDRQKPSAEAARAAMVRKQAAASTQKGELSK